MIAPLDLHLPLQILTWIWNQVNHSGLASSSPLGPITPPSASSSGGESTNILGITAPSGTVPLICEAKSPSLNTGSVVHTPGLHTSSPVATSVTPGTPPHLCGLKSPSLSTGSVVYTPGLHTHSPASSSAASTPSSSHTSHLRSAGSNESSPDGELGYI